MAGGPAVRMLPAMRTLLDTVRRRHATAAAYVALASALGGSAYAVTQVTSADIVDGTIASEDIGLNQVRSQDLAPGSVTNGRLAFAAVDSSAVKDGTLTGADVWNGSLGSDDVDLETTVVTRSSPGSTDAKTFTVTCPEGMTAMGGGAEIAGSSPQHTALVRAGATLSGSQPTADGTGWTVSATPILHPKVRDFVFGPTEEGGLHRVKYGFETQLQLAYPFHLQARVLCARL